MSLVLVLTILLVFLIQFQRKSMSWKEWTAVAILMSLISLIFAFVSVSSVWTPDITNWTVRSGDFNGSFPWSKLSYPLYMSVEHNFRRYTGEDFSGTVSFNIFFMRTNVIKVNGQFRYPAVYGEAPLSYSINFPFFNTKITFYCFLNAFFTLLNIFGVLLGLGIAYVLKRKNYHLARG